MKSSDVGLLIGELREFKRDAVRRLDKIEKQLDSLRNFKLKVMSVTGFLAFLATLIVEFIRR